MVGTQVVNGAGTQVLPAGASFANGSVIEVHCTARPNCINGWGQFVASRIEVEDAEDAQFQPSANQRRDAEGLVAGFGAHPGAFTVAGIPVRTSASTTFKGGLSTDLRNDVKVEAEGNWTGTEIAVSKIEFKRSVVRLQGTVTASAAGSFTLNIAGRSVNVETDTFTSGAVPPVGPNCVQVRGQRKTGVGLVVTAGEINNGCSNSSGQ